MTDVLDLTRDLQDLAALATEPAQVEDVLLRALEVLETQIPYDLAAVLDLDGDTLRVRTCRGPLASQRVKAHTLDLRRFPSVRAALESRLPRALLESDHAGDEGDPYDGVLDLPHGHSCMVVPLFAGDRALGALTFDRSVCQAYPQQTVALAGVVGQIVSLALLAAEQAALLDRYRHRLKREKAILEEEALGDPHHRFVLERSRSPRMQRMMALAKQAAPTDVPILLLGETGTGKEVLARALHRWSPRRERPFVALNCAALPENLVESELFGHVRGAFSGAEQARDGRFVTANGGTLLLDEIGELPVAAQAKLLRVLQEGTFEPVGSDRSVKVDVRILAATHVALEEAVADKRFRGDLLYRLNVFPLVVPPLRERLEDLPALAGAYLADVHRRTGRGPWTLTQDVTDALSARRWPGNVRELVNVLERATILSPPGPLQLDLDGGQAPQGTTGSSTTGSSTMGPMANGAELLTLAENERRHIERVLAATEGRLYGESGAAEVLGVPPSTLASRMKKLKVARPEGKKAARSTGKKKPSARDGLLTTADAGEER